MADTTTMNVQYGEMARAAGALALQAPGFWPWPDAPDMTFAASYGVGGDEWRQRRIRELEDAGSFIRREISRLEGLRDA